MLFDLLRGDHKRGDEIAIHIIYILYIQVWNMYIYTVYITSGAELSFQ